MAAWKEIETYISVRNVHFYLAFFSVLIVNFPQRKWYHGSPRKEDPQMTPTGTFQVLQGEDESPRTTTRLTGTWVDLYQRISERSLHFNESISHSPFRNCPITWAHHFSPVLWVIPVFGAVQTHFHGSETALTHKRRQLKQGQNSRAGVASMTQIKAKVQ